MNTLAKTLNWEKVNEDLDFTIHELVEAASNVIAPLGTINTFAARHPWEGLEEQPFEQVARRLKDIGDVDIYPDQVMSKTAWKRGEIDKDFLEKGLYQWIHSQNLELPFDVAEEFCKNALMGNESDFNQLAVPEIKGLVKKLIRFKPASRIVAMSFCEPRS